MHNYKNTIFYQFGSFLKISFLLLILILSICDDKLLEYTLFDSLIFEKGMLK